MKPQFLNVPATSGLGPWPSYLDPVISIAKAAGAAIMEVYDGDHQVEYKDDRSPLTAADKASHAVIVAGLKQYFPEIPILSEEGAGVPYDVRRQWDRFWLVDPLDGTKEFIKRNGEFTVNIALIEQCRPVAGVVYVPATDVLYWGDVEKGAWMMHGTDEPVEIRVRKPDHVAGLTVVMSRSHPSPELESYLRQYQIADALPVGSSLKLCVVAEGRADLYPRLGPTMEWDTAAGHAVVVSSGGSVLTLDGTPLSYNKENLLNPHFVASAT